MRADRGAHAILTPDRRLRVFVSSTLDELAAERSAVGVAVKTMHLAPVMFEHGARPHPPREVYGAYLGQSDVFIGIYWERYGWIGPGMDISGLEHEYVLSAGKPRLLYVREPAPGREPRLAALIERIEAEEAASYKIFRSTEELASLVADDLAIMVTERFGRSEPEPTVESAATFSASAPPPAASPPRERVSRRVSGVTAFLVTDVAGGREPLASSEPRSAAESYEEHARTLREVAGGHLHLVDLGDALVAVFAAPSDAMRCAVALMRTADRAARRRGVSSAARVGIQLGEPADDRDYFGPAVLQARQLCSSAAAGQIVVSDLVKALTAPRLADRMRQIGALEVTGSPALRVFDVPWREGDEWACPAPAAIDALTSRGVFVGRGTEEARLRSLWVEASTGDRRFGCVVGEPGIGKTRLVAEAARRIQREGGTVLWGRSSEELLIPYQPFVEALQHYVDSCPEEGLRQQLGSAAGVLERLVPGVRGRLGELSVPPSDQPGSERYRLFDAVSSFFAAMTDAAPTLLVLDDLHWADEASLLLLRHLLSDRRAARLLILATYRDTEVDSSHPLSLALADVRRFVAIERIRLRGLSAQELQALVTALAGWSPSDEMAAELASETQGNPFFMGEVVRHLGELNLDMAAWPSGGGRLSFEQLGVPEGVQEVVGRRLLRLSKQSIQALEIGSVVGFSFGLDVLGEVLHADEDELVGAMDEAVAAGLVAELSTRAGHYTFPHALIRHCLYQRQTATHRAALHARVGEALERLAGATPSDQLAELLGHFSHATERYASKVVMYGRAAAERALSMLAYESAVIDVTRALAAISVTAPEDLCQRAELLVLLGAAQTRVGDADSARSAFREAGEIARRSGAYHTLGEAALGYGGVAGFGGVWITFGEVDEVLVGLLESALAGFPESDDPMRARLLARLAQALYWSDEKDRVRSLSDEALGMARRLGDPAALAQALDSRHVAVWDADHLDEREALAEEILRLGEQLNDRDVRLEAYAWLITDALERGAMDRVNGYVAAHGALAEELQQPYHLWYARVAAAMQAHVEGRYADMERLIAEAWRFGEMSHGRNAQQCLYVETLFLRADQGDVGTLLDGLVDFVRNSPLWAWQVALAWGFAQDDRLDEANAEIERLAADGLDSLPRDCVSLSMMGLLADAIGRSGSVERAGELLGLLAPYEDRECGVGGGILDAGPAARYLGVLTRVVGCHDRSVGYLESALATAGTLHSPPQAVATQIELARTLRLRGGPGDAERADRLLAEAERVAGELGMGRALRDVKMVLASAEA